MIDNRHVFIIHCTDTMTHYCWASWCLQLEDKKSRNVEIALRSMKIDPKVLVVSCFSLRQKHSWDRHGVCSRDVRARDTVFAAETFPHSFCRLCSALSLICGALSCAVLRRWQNAVMTVDVSAIGDSCDALADTLLKCAPDNSEKRRLQVGHSYLPHCKSTLSLGLPAAALLL